MIYVTVGTSVFKFDRLMEYVERLCLEGMIEYQSLVIQKGYSSLVVPKTICFDFVTQEKNTELINEASYLIMHGGVGSIVNSLRKNKRIIVVPRQKKFNEHIDDNQLEIASEFQKRNFLSMANNYDELKAIVQNINNKIFTPFSSNNTMIQELLLREVEKGAGT